MTFLDYIEILVKGTVFFLSVFVVGFILFGWLPVTIATLIFGIQPL